MTSVQTPSEQITEEVTSWPGVTAGPGRRGEFAFRVNGHEIGHLHGDHAAHFSSHSFRPGSTSIGFSPRAIANNQLAPGTTRFCCCSHGWDCARSRSRAYDSTISTGAAGRSPSTARPTASISCRCPARHSLPAHQPVSDRAARRRTQPAGLHAARRGPHSRRRRLITNPAASAFPQDPDPAQAVLASRPAQAVPAAQPAQVLRAARPAQVL